MAPARKERESGLALILLVRHASAGHRRKWTGDDRLRPLDARGRRQAEGLAGLLRGHRPGRVLSSPYVRCRQTVEPLARVLGLAVEDRGELEEGASAEDVRNLVTKLADDGVVLCTHGDVIEQILGDGAPKGSTWIIRPDGSKLRRVEYLPPPS
jgi:8-oxo-(d)GTP phosphatase